MKLILSWKSLAALPLSKNRILIIVLASWRQNFTHFFIKFSCSGDKPGKLRPEKSAYLMPS
jgi:hypothetical protein